MDWLVGLACSRWMSWIGGLMTDLGHQDGCSVTTHYSVRALPGGDEEDEVGLAGEQKRGIRQRDYTTTEE